jgi:hypothetical protein
MKDTKEPTTSSGRGGAGPTTSSGILVRTHGQYYWKTNDQKGIKSFTRDVRFPSMEIFRETTRKYIGTKVNEETKLAEPQYLVNSIINIRGMLKRRFMPILLAREYTDFARIRFVSIDEVVPLDGQKIDLPINIRSRKQLAEFLREKNIPIREDEYVDIDELRSDIYDYLSSPDTFLAQKSRKDRIRNDEREFMEMNAIHETLPPRKDRVEKARGAGSPAAGSVVDEL